MASNSSDASRAATAHRAGAARIALSSRVGILDVTGGDADDYQQRMVSGDLRRTRDALGIPATLMTHKGKMVAAFEIYRRDEGFQIVVEGCAREALGEGLERLVILEDVAVVADDMTAVLSLQGPRCAAVLGAAYAVDPADEPGAVLTLGSRGDGAVRALCRARCEAGGWDLLVPEERVTEVTARLEESGAVSASLEVAEAFRIDAGIPCFGIDADATHLPLESGYDGAISYDKGCYAGQEVVARIRTYGHVNRRLCRLHISHPAPPAPGDVVRVGDRVMGVITSAAVSPTTGSAVALAYVRQKGGEPGTEVTIATGHGDLRGIVEQRGDP